MKKLEVGSWKLEEPLSESIFILMKFYLTLRQYIIINFLFELRSQPSPPINGSVAPEGEVVETFQAKRLLMGEVKNQQPATSNQ